jgi:hypothetical protein
VNYRATLCLFILGSLLLAACSPVLDPQALATPDAPAPTATEAQETPMPESVTPETPEEEASPTPADAASGLRGVVVAESDVTGLPDTPLTGHTVVAVSEEAADARLGLPAEAWDVQTLRFLQTNVEEADGAFITTTDDEGRYELLLAPGVYALCLADLAADGVTLQTHGCGRVQVEPGRLHEVDISSGFGEILLQPATEE